MVGDRSGSFQRIFLEYRAGGAHACVRHIKIGAGGLTRGTVNQWNVLCLKRLHFYGASDACHLILNALAKGLNVTLDAETQIDIFPGKRDPG